MNYSIEEFDTAKTKIMNYILYKKRTEYEVRNKFNKIFDENLVNDIIDYLKEAGYLSDALYIEKKIHEYMAINNLSQNEILYKLLSKGIPKNIIEDYFFSNCDELYNYELKSAKTIFNKKITTMEKEKVLIYLKRKGYKNSIISKIEEY